MHSAPFLSPVFFVDFTATSYADGLHLLQVLEELSEASGSTTITFLVEVFSVCSIASSMAGISVSYIDFFLDAIGTHEPACMHP